ncbi:MAG: polysaccharide biosynthesis protein, partial [Candidatus Binatia bacterium]
EIFVLEMGEPVRILDLATSLIRLAGLQPGRDIEIRITGLRPGERLHEETLIDSVSRPTGYEKIWVRPGNNVARPFEGEVVEVEGLIRGNDQDAVLEWLRRVTETAAEGEAH